MKKGFVKILILVFAGSLITGLAYLMAHPGLISDQFENESACSIIVAQDDTTRADSDTTRMKRTDFSRSGQKEK